MFACLYSDEDEDSVNYQRDLRRDLKQRVCLRDF